ncbi:hypothetical protein KKD70_01725 [Patescibacteria group bacterium]|nr:hypothetical protein [Patescibacteria group bacterium]
MKKGPDDNNVDSELDFAAELEATLDQLDKSTLRNNVERILEDVYTNVEIPIVDRLNGLYTLSEFDVPDLTKVLSSTIATITLNDADFVRLNAKIFALLGQVKQDCIKQGLDPDKILK